eukprot:6820853-Alexandrium_andersonii.AAC.1
MVTRMTLSGAHGEHQLALRARVHHAEHTPQGLEAGLRLDRRHAVEDADDVRGAPAFGSGHPCSFRNLCGTG